MNLKYITICTILTIIIGCTIKIKDTSEKNPYFNYQRIETSNGEYLHFAVIEPECIMAGCTSPVLLAMPPGDQTSDLVNWAIEKYWIEESIQRGWLVISPVAPNGKIFHVEGFDFIPDLLDWVRQNYKIEANGFHIAGISNGGRSAFQIATMLRKNSLSLTVFPGAPTSRDFLDSLIGIPVTMYVGENDSQYWKSEMYETKLILDSLGVQVQYREFPNEGHVINSLTSEMLFNTLDSLRPN